MAHVYRADTVGSLLRPQYLKLAREHARARARRPVKVTLPSPLMLFLVWSPQR